MRLIVAKDYADVSRKAANIIAAQVHLKPDCVLGLATGSSPVGTYKELIAKYESGELDFSKVKTVNLDEYVGLTKDHDQSYAYFMRTNLFDHVNIDQANCNIPDGTNHDAAAECARYDAVIESLGGVDLQLLGIASIVVCIMLLSIPVSCSIGHGICLALITYTIMKMVTGKAKEVSALTYVLSLIFLIKFFLVA